MKFALGKKLHMTQVFDADGVVHPVTVVSLEPMDVTLLRSKDKDGYSAVQLGVGTKKGTKKDTKKKAHYAEAKCEGDLPAVGDVIKTSEAFVPGDMVKVSAKSKGKGFQGVVKRYGFSGGPRTHGQKHTERSPGSIGAGISRVMKGKKMPGRMGGDNVTIKGTRVVQVHPDKNIMLLHGPLPGRPGTLIKIQGI